jgi:hypothetical protein
LNHNILIIVTINILNDCNMSGVMTFNVLELHLGYTVITTIATNSFGITDFYLESVSYNSREVVLPLNPSAATTFQAVSYNSKNRGTRGVVGGLVTKP